MFKAPPFIFMPDGPCGLLTLRPSGSMCARAHLAPNLQLPFMYLSVLCKLSSRLFRFHTHLCEIFAGSSLNCRIGRVKEGARLASLTSALPEEFAGNMFGICAEQDKSTGSIKHETKVVLLLAVLGGLLARSNCCEPPIGPFCRAWPLEKGVGICATPTAVSPFAPKELRPLYSPECLCDGRAAPGSRPDGLRCMSNRPQA